MMQIYRLAWVWTSLSLLLAPTLAWAQAASGLDEIRASMSAGDYKAAAAQIDKQLFPSAAQDDSNRFELQMLKGECRLQLKDRLGAMSSYKSAAKSAADLKQLVAARANALILERSTNGAYTPRGTGAQPIDIVSPDSRRQAMLAYADELQVQNKSQINAALGADQLAPIELVFTRVSDIFCLQTFANGQAPETEKLMHDLGSHAYKLMQAELTKGARRIDYLTQVANSGTVNARGWDTGRMGLTSQQRDEVKSIFNYLGKIRDRATEYRGVAARFGGDAAKWDALVADSVAAMTDADSLYQDR